jgi:hypothetical protein
MKREKGIDDIFKQSLQNPVTETDFAEHDWDALEKMLDRPTVGGSVFNLRYLSAVAAMLLIAFCWWIYKPAATNVQNTSQQVVKNQAKSQMQVVDTTSQIEPRVAVTVRADGKAGGEISKPSFNESKPAKSPKYNWQQPYVAGVKNKAKNSTNDLTTPVNPYQNNGEPTVKTAAVTTRQTDNIIEAAMPDFNVLPGNQVGKSLLASIGNLPLQKVVRPINASKTAVRKSVTSAAFKPQFALTILAAPELNGIGSLRSAGRGTNVGMMFTVGVKKFSLSTGVNYTVKPYTLPYSQYPSSYSYKTTPETVTADCRMLDIPINVGYQVYNRSGNKLSLGTGVSSYIMTHETYTYDYASASKHIYGPSFYAVEGRGKYPLSIMNVQATYERQINSKFGLSLQPYYKIPLSDIGYSRVRVQTFGVAVGVNWNINQLTKSK